MGAALVEFAIVAPLMILFTLGMIELGRMTMVKQLLVNVSREGARQATLPEMTTQSVKTSVEALLAQSNINGATVSVTSSTFAGSTAQYATVSIVVPSSSVSWLSKPLFMGGKSVIASTSMRKESL
jgi:Flp pilus assembly protein TadG